MFFIWHAQKNFCKYVERIACLLSERLNLEKIQTLLYSVARS